MNLLQAMTLGLIQGTTEWLPISSTGHLRLAENFFGLRLPLLFDVLLHAGTLLVTLIYFRGAIKAVLVSFWHRDFHSEAGRLVLPIIVGSIPTALIGAVVGDWFDSYFSSLMWLGVWLFVSGVLLLATKFSVERSASLSLPIAVLVGVMQGFSIIPSASRSGFTISTMLLLGIKREVAFKFAFLLSIPAVIGALGLTLYKEHGAFMVAGIGLSEVVVALSVTVFVSFLAIKLLEKSLNAKKFYLFSIYCFTLGAIMILLDVLGY
ncbi:MAG: undecaprenyl-diphosphate phosphatase [Nitrososphaerota archaeon]|jgi:undecaprenyl-diphosphatase|nr:undecaprenyl-diphosphate phosphatase [Nitrososphaerota archaeon]